MKRFNKVFTALVFIFLYAPMLLLIAASFNSGKDLAVFKSFTLYQYAELFRDDALIRLLLNSVIIAVLSSFIAAVLGTIASIGIHKMGKRAALRAMTLTNIPMTNPDIVTGISLALLFAFIGRLLGIRNILGFFNAADSAYNLQSAICNSLGAPKPRQLNPSLNEAAQDLATRP